MPKEGFKEHWYNNTKKKIDTEKCWKKALRNNEAKKNKDKGRGTRRQKDAEIEAERWWKGNGRQKPDAEKMKEDRKIPN